MTILNNEQAEMLIDEIRSSLPDWETGVIVDALTMHMNGRRVGDAQIVAECLTRIMPGHTAEWYEQACTDTLRYYCDGDNLDVICPRCKGNHAWCQQVQSDEY